MTLDEWQEWQIHPATKAFLSYLQQAQKELQRQWANGGLLQSADGTVQLNAEALGMYRALSQLLELDYETIKEGFDG